MGGGRDAPDIPDYLALERHRDYAGRQGVRLFQRLVTGVFVVFIGLAVVNVFGQQPDTSVASAPQASVHLSTPHRLRLGLVFQTRIDIYARSRIGAPTLVLSRGWFDGMTLNSVNPAPASQTGADGAVSFSYPPLGAGRELTVWFEWSVNPTNVVWDRSQLFQLSDGSVPILDLRLPVTVFP